MDNFTRYDTDLQSFVMRQEAGVRGYGHMLRQLLTYFLFCVRNLAWLIDVRRLLIVLVILVGLSLLTYLVVKELALRAAQTQSRCYQTKQKYSRNSQATAILSKKGVNLLTVSYDMRARIARTACSCPGGNVMNGFSYFRFDFKTMAITRDTGNCMCDNDYVALPDSVVLSGSTKLVQFMQTGSSDDAKDMFGLVASNQAIRAAAAPDASSAFPSPKTPVLSLTTPTSITTGGGYKFTQGPMQMNYTTGFTMICQCNMQKPSNSDMCARIFDFGKTPTSVALPQIGLRLFVRQSNLVLEWNDPSTISIVGKDNTPSNTTPPIPFTFNTSTVLAVRYQPSSSAPSSGTISIFVNGTSLSESSVSNVTTIKNDLLMLGTDLWQFTNSTMSFNYFYWFDSPFTDSQIKAFTQP